MGTMKAENYYDVLQVDTACTSSEIKRAFRKKVKETHPDVYGVDGAEYERMHLLLRAYETLLDPEKRRTYDLTHAIHSDAFIFEYRTYLQSEPGNPEACSKLIFHDLLHGFKDDAVETYNRCMTDPEYSLDRWLDRGEYMDCVFLLAEALEERGDVYRAFSLFMEIVELEQEKPFFRHFFVEVAERVRRLISMKLASSLSKNGYLGCLERAAACNIQSRDTAYYLKRAAEIYCERGQLHTAAQYMEKAFELDPKLGGTKKIMDMLVRQKVPAKN